MHPLFKKRRPDELHAQGFTLLELITVILLILIVASIITPYLNDAINAAYRVRCVSNLRNLHVGFESYLQDHKMWPQQLTNFTVDQDEDYENWWLTTMDPYVPSRKVWQCPILAAQKVKNFQGKLLQMHYSPTMFDANPISPHRWSKQPWIIELTNAHGHGPLVLMPDGSVSNYADLVKFSQ
ncbi:MAG: prepilin-type N-terminal cleavage/methylation domain-containing protein [Chthoniobacterales bacterium]